jgi:ABC-type antimicrobial peptide transport system permease subunit
VVYLESILISNTGVRRILVNKSLFNPVFNYRFKTRSLPIFNYYHDLFYLKNNETWKYYKVVPSNIKDFINPVVLAYLIMSDGNFDKSINRVRIYTNSYSKQDVERIASAIQSNLNIYVGVLHDRKDQWILTIGAQQLDELRNLVSPHFEPSMLYRLGY